MPKVSIPTIKVGDYVKIKTGLSDATISDYNLHKLRKAHGVFQVAHIAEGYFTTGDIVYMDKKQNWAVPRAVVELATENDVARFKWFTTRPLDITQHPKTKIFR